MSTRSIKTSTCSSRSCQIEFVFTSKTPNRKYCSRTCASREAQISRGELTKLRGVKECTRPECSNPTTNAKYCSQSCSAKVNNSKYPKYTPRVSKLCLNLDCNILTYGKFCSKKCAGEHKTKTLVTDWIAERIPGGGPDGAAPWARRYIIEQANSRCEVCGWGELNPVTNLPVLAVDHVDGNRANNKRSNLKCLCLNHHGLTPTFGFLNSKYMREKLGISFTLD